jgi:hypothetical protein
VVERRVLRRGFASKEEEVTGHSRRHNKELHNLSYSLNIISTVIPEEYDRQSI